MPSGPQPDTRTPPHRPRQRWLWMVALAVLIHLPLVQMVGLLGDEPTVVRVVSMTPAVGGDTALDAEGPIDIVVELDLAADAPAPSPLGARLMFTDVDGNREMVGFGRVDPDHHGRLLFTAPRREGTYQVWLAAAGPQRLLGDGYVLDGEWSAPVDGEIEVAAEALEPGEVPPGPERHGLPSGNGEPGGDFVAWLRVTEVEEEPIVVAANLVSEVPDPDPSTAGASPTPVDAAPAPRVEAVEEPPEQPPEAQPEPSRRASTEDTTPTPPQPDVQPTIAPPPLVERELPMPRQAQPNKEAEIADLLQVDAGDLSGIIGDDVEALSRARQAERENSGPLAGWEEELAQTMGTFNGNGPRVRPGNQQAVSTHRKEIYAYIAAMHKIIHHEWADTYLINLDLTQYGPANPINDPQLRTVLELEVSEEGKVTDVQIVASSGIQTYDAEAIRIAWRSGPREPVPETMLSPNDRAYLHWSFHRDQRQCGTFGVEVFILDEDGSRDSVHFDQEKVLAEEERIGVRNGGRGTGAPPPPTTPAGPVGGGGDTVASPAAPANDPDPQPLARDAEPDTADAEPEPEPRPQTRKRKARPQTRNRGID